MIRLSEGGVFQLQSTRPIMAEPLAAVINKLKIPRIIGMDCAGYHYLPGTPDTPGRPSM